jgi:predicted permease
VTWSWFGRRSRRAELDAELAAPLEIARRARLDAGDTPDAADVAARRELGNALVVSENTRDTWRGALVEQTWRDARHAVGLLRRSPAFTVTAILSLAFGICATTCAFSIADALLLRPLAVREPGRLLVLTGRTPQAAAEELSYPDLVDIREQCRSLSGMAASRTVRVAVGESRVEAAQARFALMVTDGFFDVLGVGASVGRTFTHDETSVRGRGAAVVLGHAYWTARFGSDPGVVGRSLPINGVPFTIVGVAPPTFTGLSQFLQPAMFLPVVMTERLWPHPEPLSIFDRRDDRAFVVRARLAPGASAADAARDLALVSARLRVAHPDLHRGRSFHLATELQARAGEAPATVAIAGAVLGLAIVVLVIACANVAGLQLARGQARAQEMATRVAMGAGHARLLRQLMTENLVLAAGGAVLGVAGAFTVVRALAALQLPTDTPLALAVAVDLRVLAVALVATLASALVFGLAPAWRAGSGDLATLLRARGTPGLEGSTRARAVLVAGQVALSVVLLVLAGALVDGFRQLASVDPGVRARDVLMLELDPALVGYGPEETRQFYRTVVERARTLPGVRTAALAGAVPFRPNFSSREVVPEGHPLPDGVRGVRVSVTLADDAYFDTMGTSLVAGRGFGRGDDERSPLVAIVNAEMARLYWPGAGVVGRRLRLAPDGPFAEIVGVARTGKYVSLAEAPQPHLYLPWSQHDRSRLTLLVRAHGEPGDLARPLAALVRSIDPRQPVFNVRDFQTYMEQGALGVPRTLVRVAATAGAAGLALAVIGLYGLVAFAVTRRTAEIGLRMAVGARPAQVIRLVMRQGLSLTLAGMAMGLVASVPLFHSLAALFVGVGALSPLTLVAVPLLLLGATMSACLAPAWRATRIDPTRALRAE